MTLSFSYGNQNTQCHSSVYFTMVKFNLERLISELQMAKSPSLIAHLLYSYRTLLIAHLLY